MISNFNYPKGAEWRKWDLHVHTPYSLVQHFSGSDEESRWEKYITDLESLPVEIQVLGINDYLFIEGYKKILKYRKEGRLKNIKTIFPVVEFRIKKFAGHKEFKRINFHVIFSDELSPEIIESQFLNGLSSKYKLSPGASGVNWNGLITRESLTDLGKAIKESVPEDQLQRYGSDLLEGFNNLNLDEEDILTLLKENSYLKGNTLTAVGKTEWDSLSWNDNSIGEKKDIINKVDFVFISSETAEAFHNAKSRLTSEAVNNLLLDCSDAHYNIESPQKDRIGKCFTWIKADPTFNGLKQVIHEPLTRILIRDEHPDLKTDYDVIDRISFVGDDDSEHFTDGLIELNPNLNVIIGGKSSGKSLLLFHIAKTIDPIQVKEKLEIVNVTEYELQNKIKDFDFEVHWKDGLINKLNENIESKSRQITYVPQMYINHLAEQKGENELTELLDSILLQNVDFKDCKEGYLRSIKEINLETSNNINEIFTIKESYQTNFKELKDIGDKSAIEGNIKNIQKEIDELKQKSGFTEADDKAYAALLKRKEILSNNNERINRYLARSKEYIDLLESLKEELNLTIGRTLDSWSELDEDIYAQNFIKKNILIENNDFNLVFDRLLKKHINLQSDLQNVQESKKQLLEDLEIEFQPYRLKITNQSQLGILSVKLEEDNNKLKRIAEKEKQIARIVAQGKSLKESILSSTADLLQYYNIILDKVRNPEMSEIGHGLKLNASLEIDDESFQNGFCNLIDGRSNFNTLFGSAFNSSNDYIYIESTHLENVKNIFEKIWAPEKYNIKFKTGFSSKEAVAQLLKDNFKIKYNIEYNGDDILQMSPGKRGLVLMQIILHLSNAKHPILIDQPEDNLDNRTIFNDLNEFIKSKKNQRQIILVTHNANLVVSTDAEQVIVANQNGQDKGKSNEKYQFEYISGSLENTFKAPFNLGVLKQMGIREHVCDILEGGEKAFQHREKKYGFI